jgi:hypothetical protein
MKIQIELDKDNLIEKLEQKLRFCITFAYRWLTNEGEALGYILGSLHFMLFVFLVLLVIACHTVYTNFWFQFSVFICIFLIWIQHIFLKVCISIVAEKNFTNSTSPFHRLLEDVLNISPANFGNYFVVAETAALGSFGLELISRTSTYIQCYLSGAGH